MANRYFRFSTELCEEWALANSRECVEGVVGGVAGPGVGHEDQDDVGARTASEATFTLKYLGSTLVETPSNEEATAEAIKTVITMVSIPRNNYTVNGRSEIGSRDGKRRRETDGVCSLITNAIHSTADRAVKPVAFTIPRFRCLLVITHCDNRQNKLIKMMTQ